MKIIPLTKGKQAIVDDEDFELVGHYKWCFSRYAVRSQTIIPGRQAHIYMHRMILGFPDGLEVDHINGNKLDNRRSNLRTCTRRQNCFNLPKHPNRSSKFKGVGFHKSENKFRAYIRINGRNKHLGHFATPELAHESYKKAATTHFGEFARFQ